MGNVLIMGYFLCVKCMMEDARMMTASIAVSKESVNN